MSKREIKFRAWDESIEKIVTCGDDRRWGNVTNHYLLRNYPEDVLMQYTGLTDKNGQEIYEGDLVWFRADFVTSERQGEYIGEIYWDESHVGFMLNVAEQDEPYDIYGHTDEFYAKAKVVGSIHETPELLDK